jgi:dihydrofolate reductase
MRKVIYQFTVSIDGFIESPADSTWMIPSPELHQHFNDFSRENIDTEVYGRVMWELMAGFWPTADSPSQPPEIRDYARIWRSLEKVVFSRTLDAAPGARLLRSGIAEEVARLKAAPGKGIGVGGAQLAAEFLRLGLIDEVRMYVAPVLLGSGKPMFQGVSQPLSLEPLEVSTIGEVTLLRYAVPR